MFTVLPNHGQPWPKIVNGNCRINSCILNRVTLSGSRTLPLACSPYTLCDSPLVHRELQEAWPQSSCPERQASAWKPGTWARDSLPDSELPSLLATAPHTHSFQLFPSLKRLKLWSIWQLFLSAWKLLISQVAWVTLFSIYWQHKTDVVKLTVPPSLAFKASTASPNTSVTMWHKLVLYNSKFEHHWQGEFHIPPNQNMNDHLWQFS